MSTKLFWKPERFHDPRYSRPRYRLRSSVKLTWQLGDGGYTHGSYKFKRDAQKRCDELNQSSYVTEHEQKTIS